MKLAVAITTPEVSCHVPVVLLSGSFSQRLQKAAALGYEAYLSAELLPRPSPDEAASATLRHMRPLVSQQTTLQVRGFA